jgi:putative phage-type endonuclease
MNTTRDEFLASRATGIGGSDIAAVLGLSPYKTPLDIWREKTRRAPDVEPDADARERMQWGTVLEAVVANHYSEVTGARVQRINGALRSPRCSVAIANIDRAVVAPGSRARWDDATGRVRGASHLLEVKTAHALALNGAEWGEPGTDEVPPSYWLQCQWYLGVTGLERADLAVLFGGQKFRVYQIALDQSIVDGLFAEAADWWARHVEADMPPEPRTEDEARSLWRSHVAGREKIVDVNVANAVRELATVKARIAELEGREQELRDAVLPAFGDAEAITYMGRRLATWKQNKASTKTDWKGLCSRLSDHVDPTLAAELLDTHTTTTEGARVLRLNMKEL